MIAAIVPAAGLSSRMDAPTPKPLLPWGPHTVIEQVVTTLLTAGLEEIVVVTGHRRAELEAQLAGYAVRCVFNPRYRQGEMLSSVQVGLRSLPARCTGALLALADQPQMQAAIVGRVIQAFAAGGGEQIVAPSHQMRRGHPICLPWRLWPAVLALREQDTLRSLIRSQADAIRYVVVDTPSVLADIDTPEQYRQALQAQQSRKTAQSDCENIAS